MFVSLKKHKHGHEHKEHVNVLCEQRYIPQKGIPDRQDAFISAACAHSIILVRTLMLASHVKAVATCPAGGPYSCFLQGHLF